MKKELAAAIANIEKQLGKGVVINFEDDSFDDIEMVSSGSLKIDDVLGGGYPIGRVVEIFGPESSGKSTLAIHALIEGQKVGMFAVYIDSEHAFDKYYAENLGLDFSKEKLLFSQPDYGEQGFEVISSLIDSKIPMIIIIDSVTTMIPKAELEGDMGDSKMGLHARLMSQALRKLMGKINKSKSIAIFLGQTREKIGVMFGSPEVTTGGNALKFYASQRIRTSKSGIDKDGEEVVAIKVKVDVKKNKVAPPFKKCIVTMRFGEGLDMTQEIIDIAVDHDIIKKSGSWYTYGETKLGQGNEKVRDLLLDNPELTAEIKEKILKL